MKIFKLLVLVLLNLIAGLYAAFLIYFTQPLPKYYSAIIDTTGFPQLISSSFLFIIGSFVAMILGRLRWAFVLATAAIFVILFFQFFIV